jgi:CRP-like cAMP-binding protein
MLLVEKVILLKSTDIFQNTPEQELIDIAFIMQEIEVEAGTTLFEKGDEGNSLYLVYKGSVSIHDGNHQFAVLEPNEIFEIIIARYRATLCQRYSDHRMRPAQAKPEPFYEVLMQNSKSAERHYAYFMQKA